MSSSRHFRLVLCLLLIGSLVGCSRSASGRVASAATVPRIEASPWTPWIAVSSFGADEPVTIAVDLDANGLADFTATQITDVAGNTVFNMGSINMSYGAIVTAVSATHDKTLVVSELRVEYVNAGSNVVAGVGPASTSLTVMVMQAGPPLATAIVATDSTGHWSYDFSGMYEIEPGREVGIEKVDYDGDVTRSSWRAVVPTIVAGYSQSGANSLIVRSFSPGTTVRVRVDFANDGGPIGGYDIDHAAVVDSPYAFGYDLGGFDVLRAGDRIIATGGGWLKELVTVPLRIEKGDAANDVVGGIATAGNLVVAAIAPPSGGGAYVSMLPVIAGTGGRWSADFSGIYDLIPGQNVAASVADSDGDETSSTWRAIVPHFSASVTDGPPSQVKIWDYAVGTEVRLVIDYGGDGSIDVDTTKAVTQNGVDTFDLGGSGLLHLGDAVSVAGGDWWKSGVLVPISLDSASSDTDRVTGTATVGTLIHVDISTPPGEPGGPPVASKVVEVDSNGYWVADFGGQYDMVSEQQVSASIFDADGDVTEALGWARIDAWPKSGFENPVWNPPAMNQQKAGSVVPLKFSLDGDRGIDIFMEGYPASSAIPCNTPVEAFEGEPISTVGRSVATYDLTRDLYEIRWRTQKSWRGTCRQLVVHFVDGTYMRANFRFA